jgi:signal transduction histidine kinase
MHWASIFRSGAFRFALLLAALFACGSAAVLVMVEHSISRYALEATAGGLESEAAILGSEQQDGGRPALVRAIARHRRAGADQQFRYLLRDRTGEVVTTDFGPAIPGIGWGSVLVREKAPYGGETFETFKSLGVRLADASLLVVATDTYDIQTLRRELDGFTMLCGAGITLFALVGGYLVGGLFLRRLERVNTSVEQIMEGSLAERLPTIGISPEFDLLTANLNRMLDRIGSLMEGLQQVSTDIAHDLRTPLTRLRQQLESLQEAASIERYAAGVEIAIAQTDEILAIFRALLRIGTLEGGVGRQRFARVDLSEVMDRVFQAYQPVAEDEGKILVAEHAPGTMVDGDAELLAQTFTNLIDNALVHTPPGTRIVSRLEQREGRVVASVADDGTGIAANDWPNVVKRFYRLDRSRNLPGAGLGLALVAAIAALHEARLELADNRPGLRVGLVFPP